VPSSDNIALNSDKTKAHGRVPDRPWQVTLARASDREYRGGGTHTIFGLDLFG
jgi:hypothetical protein